MKAPSFDKDFTSLEVDPPPAGQRLLAHELHHDEQLSFDKPLEPTYPVHKKNVQNLLK